MKLSDRKTKVLVVEDDVEYSKVIADFLQLMNINDFVTAKGPQEAKNQCAKTIRLKEQTFDLVLCDWKLPKESGLEFLMWLRDHPIYYDVKFMMITGQGSIEDVREAIWAGADRYLLKPFDFDHFEKHLEKLLAL